MFTEVLTCKPYGYITKYWFTTLDLIAKQEFLDYFKKNIQVRNSVSLGCNVNLFSNEPDA